MTLTKQRRIIQLALATLLLGVSLVALSASTRSTHQWSTQLRSEQQASSPPPNLSMPLPRILLPLASASSQSSEQPSLLIQNTTGSVTTTTAAPVQSVQPSAPMQTQTVGADDYDAWTRVADCEEGGWIGSSGSAYPDSLGISAANWYAFGGSSDVSPAAQIAVADRLVSSLGIAIPDQGGCSAW